MPDQKKPPPKKKPKGIGDEIAGGADALKKSGYRLYRREAEAMGDEPMSFEEWAASQRDE